MKHIYIVIMLSMPVYLHAQTVAPRRPLALDPPTRKSLVESRERISKRQKEETNTHERVAQQRSNRLVKAG